MWYVYILKSLGKKWYYVGSTNRLQQRIAEHNNRRVISTKTYVPLKLVYSESFDSERKARDYERMIKDKRILKESLIKKIENNCGIV